MTKSAPAASTAQYDALLMFANGIYGWTSHLAKVRSTTRESLGRKGWVEFDGAIQQSRLTESGVQALYRLVDARSTV